ncbi:RHS repeat-associated core domain-containing protein, partial [Hymenobacter rubripertinctus]
GVPAPAPDGSSRKVRILPLLSVGLGLVPAVQQLSGGVPRAYVRVLVYNADSALVDSQTRQLTQVAQGGYEALSLRVFVPAAGYVQAYVANESDTDVFFDDVSVQHRQGLQVQENHYDPFGLDLAGLSKSATPQNKFTWNGKEQQTEFGLGWHDYGARMYESTIGRWNVVDPLAFNNYMISPYTYCLNNPPNVIDPDGRDAIFTVDRDKDNNIIGLNISSTNYIKGSGASASRASQLNSAAKDKFKTRNVGGISVSFDVKYSYAPDKQVSELREGQNLIEFSSQISTSEDRSHASSSQSGNPDNNTLQVYSGNYALAYDNGRSNNTILHETLHLLGVSDRYYEEHLGNGGGSRPVGSRFYDDIMAVNFSDPKRSAGVSLNYSHYMNFAEFANNNYKFPGISAIGYNGATNPAGDIYVNKRSIDVNSNSTIKGVSDTYRYEPGKYGTINPIQ